jgi:dihydrofolate reductase
MMTVSIIVAVADGNAIGRHGDLLFPISADLKRFKAITMGHPIIMGRKTFESFPKGPLPGRHNIVVTRNVSYAPEGVTVVNSLEEAIATAADDGAAETFIIGGAQIYNMAISVADKLYLTVIDASAPDADTFFPPINHDEWVTLDKSDEMTDQRSGLKYRFVCLTRK